jgi:hypothetical protein
MELDDGGATTVRRRAPPSRRRPHDCSSPARSFQAHGTAEERCLCPQQVRASETTPDAGALPHAQRYRVVVASVDVSAEFSNGSRLAGTATLGQVRTHGPTALPPTRWHQPLPPSPDFDSPRPPGRPRANGPGLTRATYDAFR